ncbi:MAG: NAD(P)-dependent oxidoreductase [candidate division KSB1 bacterium]|nr:NAD(P)-dependent oxidoreductase [candidate division KSB1 bacterium]MDZ7275623.1 NAD(P)-dependent oxidoreductase [candidate division KSB1 bacterium]MDZ7284686.1 NAD(P)-dependent oxidoreductase [candidate division KSB1 bacterium]MDZ7297895.1 NAD(P)-dependent oxidoreductase [candidate division KSB1 bacterium]MDZ7305977.1 NAD(P)-dependent oxidoreductase [candidate division KSB1 bacterium]
MKLLVTGGAGYVGSVLIPRLLTAGHRVRVLDNLMYGGASLLPFFSDPKFEFLKGNILDEARVREATRGVDAIIHLAAIVGYPACKKNEQLAHDVNYIGTKIVEKNRDRNQLLIYASTGSNYGAVVGQICTEETPLNPLTIYGTTKTQAERHLLASPNTICFRYATAFGVSPRMRLDLLINDFVYQAVKVRNLIVYERTFKRTFIHVIDMARSFMFALENADRMIGQVYNVGSEQMNYSKEQIAELVRRKVDFYLHYADVGKDEDQRNYEVSYAKINALGFYTTISVEEGVDELIRAYETIDLRNPLSNV